MNKFFLLLFMPILAFAADCPPESIDVEYVSPITYHKKVTCGYMQDGVMVKHGPETEYSSDGKVLKVIQYDKGEEGKAAITSTSSKNDPDAEAFLKAAEESFAVITELLKVFAYDKSGLNGGEFKVNQCDPKPKQWAMAAITKKDVSKSYSFNDNCDVAGSFTASFVNPFPVTFELRHLKDFNNTAMTVKMTVDKTNDGIRYRFEAGPATVSAPAKKVEFKAHYEVTIDPLSGTMKLNTHEGTITLLKVGDKTLNIEKPLVFK